MTPGTQNFTKIKCFNFLQFSWPRVHETSQKSNPSIFSNCHDPGYTKHHKNQILQFSPIFQALALESNQFPLLLLLAFLSSTRFAATCAFVGYRATKIGLWEIQISPGYLFLERKPPHLGVFYTVKWERPQGKDLFHHNKTTKSRALPQCTVYVKKNGRQSKPRMVVFQWNHRKKNWSDRWPFWYTSNRPKLGPCWWVIRYNLM